MKRKRIVYAALVLITIVLGLVSRQSFVPAVIFPFIGDALYAIMIFFIIGFLFPRLSTFKAIVVCLSICYSIELSQLIQVAWLNAIRESRLGALVLGFGFLWSDLVSYTIGSLIAGGIEFRLLAKWQ